MKSSLDIIVSILEQIMDKAILAAVDLAMGASLSWTGIGGAAAIAAAMAIVALGAADWIKVVALLDEMFEACSIFAGVAQGMTAQIGDMSDLPLPAGSYDNPQV